MKVTRKGTKNSGETAQHQVDPAGPVRRQSRGVLLAQGIGNRVFRHSRQRAMLTFGRTDAIDLPSNTRLHLAPLRCARLATGEARAVRRIRRSAR